MGDLREGITPEGLEALVANIETLEYATIVGIGTNLACHVGLMPDEQNMAILSTLAHQTETQLGRKLDYVSAGNSSSIPLMISGNLPRAINHFRLGESLLLGLETATGTPIAVAHQNVFSVVAQILELWWREVGDSGARGANALGRKTEPMRRGKRRLALINFGAIDAEISGLTPMTPDIECMGFSSDHMIIDVTRASTIAIGDEIEFTLNYYALATAMSSPYLLQVDVDGGDLPAITDREKVNV